MINIEGFEDYTVKVINTTHFFMPAVYYSHGALIERKVEHTQHDGFTYKLIEDNSILETNFLDKFYSYVPISKILEDAHLNLSCEIVSPKPGDTLFFDPGCTIPRSNCATKWKRTLKPSKADVVVLPDKAIIRKFTGIIFKDDEKKILYLIDRCYNNIPPSIGDTFSEFYKTELANIAEDTKNIEQNKKFLEEVSTAKCFFVGHLTGVKKKDMCLFHLFNGKYTKVIRESQLQKLIENEDADFTIDVAESLIDSLKSSDSSVVLQGLRTMAAMNYSSYPNVARYILNRCNRVDSSLINGSGNAVKFMIKQLSPIADYSKDITPKELPIMEQLFREKITRRIKDTLLASIRCDDISINFEYSFSLSLDNTPMNPDKCNVHYKVEIPARDKNK